MIGCTTMERHIVAASLKSPLERLAGHASPDWTFADVPANYAHTIDARCDWLYVDITHDSQLSAEVWAAILYQEHKHAHTILYVLDFKLDPGFSTRRGWQELALYPLRTIDKGTPTYVTFTPPPEEDEDDSDVWMNANTYSLHPIVTSGA